MTELLTVAPPRDLTEFMSAFPSGVAIVTARSPEHGPQGLTCSSLISVTLDPPTLLVSLKSRSPVLAAIRRQGRFAVNLLRDGGERAARTFSSPVADRFGEVAWCDSPALGLPWLAEDAFALAECALTETHAVGDHVLVLGRVANTQQCADASPLLYGLRSFTSWPSGPSPDGRPRCAAPHGPGAPTTGRRSLRANIPAE
ncbi:flavin reductase family protein [Streptomyces sp. NPDC048507]|uniref:flavin reductase family protein n=1 Tax=Streptomyces sp. NPDC048507 TaxID=3365560 RepID=UPI003715099B